MPNNVGKNSALFVTTVSSFITPFMASSVNIALPSIGKEFAMDAILLSWVGLSYSLAAAMFLVPFGRAADIVGRKKVFTYGVVIHTITSLLSAIAPSAIWLIGFRAMQGVSGAMIFGTSVAILTSVYPAGERGKALGINVGSVYLGLSLGPSVGGFLTQHLGWRSIFLCAIPLGIPILAAIPWKLKEEWAEAEGERFDFVGSVVYGLALLALMYGFSRLPATLGAWLILLGILGILAFVLWEGRTPSPVLNVSLFRNSTVYTFSNLAALINYSATSAVGFLLSLYLQNVKGLDPQTAGIVMIAQPVMQAIFSPFTGQLSDRVEPRLVASTGMGLNVIGLVLFISLGEKTPLALIVLSLVLLGFGFALFSSPNTNAIMSAVEKKYYGVASATLGTMRLVGQMLSVGIAMLVFATVLGRVQITPESYPLFIRSSQIIFTVFALLCLGGVFASLARGKLRKT